MHCDVETKLNSKLQHLLSLSKISQTRVAADLNLNRSNLNQVLNGKVDLSASTLIMLLEYFGIDLMAVIDARLDELMGRETRSQNPADAVHRLIESLGPVQRKAVYQMLLSQVGKPTKAEAKDDVRTVKEMSMSIRTYSRRADGKIHRPA